MKLTIADSGEIENRVRTGQIEIGVIGSKSSHPNISCQRLWKDELVLAIPAQHPWARRTAVSLKELRETPFILREEGSGTLKILEAYLHESGEDGTSAFQISARFGSSTAVKEGIKSGLGPVYSLGKSHWNGVESRNPQRFKGQGTFDVAKLFSDPE